MSRERGSLRRHPVVRFVVLTFAISWAAWSGVIVLDPDFSLSPMLSLLGGLGPIIAAGILSWSDGTVGEWVSRAVRWRVPVKWWIVALVLPVILSLVGWAIFLTVSDVSIAMTESPLYVVYPTVFLLVFFLQGGYGEEMGWRGYALPHLLDTYNPTVAGLLLGLVWAVWHLPLFFTRGSSQSGSFSLYLVGVVGLSIILTWLFINARGSVLLVVVFHAQWNVFDSGALFEVGAVQGLLAPAASTAVIWFVALILIAIYGLDLSSSRDRAERRSEMDGLGAE